LNDPVDRFCGSFKLYSTDGTPIAHDRCWMALALQRGSEFNGREIVIERPDGTWLTALAHANPIRNHSGELLGAVNVLVDISERKRVEEELRRARKKLGELAAHLESVREAERVRLARELHDELGATLTALKIDLGLCAPRVRGRKFLEERLPNMKRSVESMLASVKRITTELRPSILDHLGLWAAIEWQAQEFGSRLSIPCTVAVRAPSTLRITEGERASAIFRIVQESLTNIARHAKATKVEITVSGDDKQVVVDIRDNGKGIRDSDLVRESSWGIVGMRERARFFDGHLEIARAPKGGTSVRLRIPIAKPRANKRKTRDETPAALRTESNPQ
jgi:signal transduction histidine kinase